MNFFQKVQNTKNTLKGFKVNNMNKIDYKYNSVGEKVERFNSSFLKMKNQFFFTLAFSDAITNVRKSASK